jgi:hypothetical protein
LIYGHNLRIFAQPCENASKPQNVTHTLPSEQLTIFQTVGGGRDIERGIN